MLGEIVYHPRGDGRPRRTERYGLPLLAVPIRPGGWRERGRLRSAAWRLARQGVGRVLVPPEFAHWPLLEGRGLRPVDPLPFLRRCAGELVLAAMVREGVPPQQGTAALRGRSGTACRCWRFPSGRGAGGRGGGSAPPPGGWPGRG